MNWFSHPAATMDVGSADPFRPGAVEHSNGPNSDRAFQNGAIGAFLSSATDAIDGAISMSGHCNADELQQQLRRIRAELVDLLPILTAAR